MTEVVITNETKAIAVYKVNFEQVKKYLAGELKKYDNIVVSEEYMTMAKKSRAELNKMKSELKARLSEVRNAQLKPYNDLKENYTNYLEQMIDFQLEKIDTAIKNIEFKKAEKKEEEIVKYFRQINARYEFDIEIGVVFNPKWTNQTYSMNKIKSEIDSFFQKVQDDLSVIDSFDKEFVIPLRNIYLKCFDMGAVMRNKIEFDREKQKMENSEKKEDMSSETPQANLRVVENNKDTNIPEVIKSLEETHSAFQIERIEFWVEVTPEQKAKMRNFVLENNIKCGKIQR
jgi:hypothetical protein